jgi:hypothetical protein
MSTSSYTIAVPKDLILDDIVKFGNALENIPQVNNYVFDFQEPNYITPFGMLYISNSIVRFRERNQGAKFTAKNCTNSYAGHMGFYQACGFDVGKLPGEANGNTRYLPLTELHISELKEKANKEMVEIEVAIEKKAQELAHILTQDSSSSITEMLIYSIREIFRNVFEHSESDFLFFCAQYMPSKKNAEIAILDNGVGIKRSLSNNPFLIINDDHEAINLSLMPGVSGKMYKGIKHDANDYWHNSGYGLYGVSRLCGIGGNFFIASGKAGLRLKPTERKYYETTLKGTAIRMNLCSKDIKHLNAILTKIMKEGDEEAKKIVGVDFIEASTASRMLSKEFGTPKM